MGLSDIGKSDHNKFSASNTSYRTSRRAREEQRRDSVNASMRTFPEQPIPLITKRAPDISERYD